MSFHTVSGLTGRSRFDRPDDQDHPRERPLLG